MHRLTINDYLRNDMKHTPWRDFTDAHFQHKGRGRPFFALGMALPIPEASVEKDLAFLRDDPRIKSLLERAFVQSQVRSGINSFGSLHQPCRDVYRPFPSKEEVRKTVVREPSGGISVDHGNSTLKGNEEYQW